MQGIARAPVLPGAYWRNYTKVLSSPSRKEVEFSSSKVKPLQLPTEGRLDAHPLMQSSSDFQNLSAEPRTVLFQLMNYILKLYWLLKKAKFCYC